jgi:hypothetical protein
MAVCDASGGAPCAFQSHGYLQVSVRATALQLLQCDRLQLLIGY